MKKRSISFILVLVMLFSIMAPDRIVGAEDSHPSIEEASAQKEEPDTNTEETLSSAITETEEKGSDENKQPAITKTEEPESDGQKAPAKTPAKAPAKAPAEEPEFDESKPFTMAMLEEAGSYTMDMNGMVEFKNFELEAKTNDGDTCTEEECKLHFENPPENIQGGELEKNVPSMAYNAKNAQHVYTYAHVGQTKVYYVGNLTIYHNDGTKTPYVFYTTDKHIDKKTVYAVLKENEKISLVYQHGTYHNIKYKLVNKNGEVSEEDKTNGWTEDEVFGAGRVKTVAEGAHFNGTVQIPRGYTAKVTVKKADGTVLYDGIDLGKMMKYSYNPQFPNQIPPDEGNNTALIFTDSFGIENVESDVTVTVAYEKIKAFIFNARYWSQTAKAANRNDTSTNKVLVNYRISIPTSSGDIDPDDSNSILNFSEAANNSVTWKFNGITSGLDRNQTYTWEMNQLEINGEPIEVPMITLDNDGQSETKTTTLSTGTVITLSVTSKGGNNGSTGRREYILTATNCYEDLTISGGNMVGHIHREFATRALIGVEKSEYWHGNEKNPQALWMPLKQDTLIDKRNDAKLNGVTYPYDIAAPFRLKPALGYGKLNVSFTDKESKGLQTNDKINTEVTNEKFIEYLIRTDIETYPENSANEKSRGEYRTVSYDNWKPSADGYYYCRATQDLDTYMKTAPKNGVVLLWFYADMQKYGIDYKDGARTGEADKAPAASDIEFMPGYQNGGDKGYNILTNAKALVSNTFPVDKTGKFVFDYWEILLVENGVVTDKAKDDITDADSHFKNELEAGDTIPLTEKALVDLGDCLYYHPDHQRNTLTLRAVWKERGQLDPIDYTVNYYLTEVENGKLVNPELIEQHQHTVNEGAMLVSDLWQDEYKTLSANIMEILQGNNDNLNDYTEEGTVEWVIYEPTTTMKIDSVNKNNNIANIYLVRQPKLTIGKTVTGKYGDLTKSFKFKIDISKGDNSLNGTYSYTGGTVSGVSGATAPANGTLTFTNGEAEIELAHGQQITFTNLPFGSDYTVTEEEAAGYETSYSSGGSKVEKVAGVLESDVSVTVTNTKEDIPDTGMTDSVRHFGILAGIGVTALLLLLILFGIRYYRKKA